MPEPVDRKDPISDEERQTAAGSEHPERKESERELEERQLRDREELGRPPAEARERALAEDVTERRDREAREEAARIQEEDAADTESGGESGTTP